SLFRGRQQSPPTNGGVAVLPAAKPVVIQVPHDERREPFLEVYRKEGSHARLVCAVEMLSPSNKTPGEAAQGLYLKKQKDLLSSQVPLLEIALLRGGHHTPAAPRAKVLEKAGTFDYHVCCHRVDRFNEYQVYPILLQEPLPIISIPLLNDDHVEVNLQEVFTL